MNLLVSAGEASGDLHGSRLVRALGRRRCLTAFGMGGARLAAEGVDCVARSEDLAVMGVSEVLGKLPAVFRAFAALRREATLRRPEAAVLIDFPDFNAVLARRLWKQGVPLIYYVSPQVWAWRPARAGVIARRARRILTLFPFEAEIYRRLGADAVWTGHPIVEDVRRASRSLHRFRRRPARASSCSRAAGGRRSAGSGPPCATRRPPFPGNAAWRHS